MPVLERPCVRIEIEHRVSPAACPQIKDDSIVVVDDLVFRHGGFSCVRLQQGRAESFDQVLASEYGPHGVRRRVATPDEIAQVIGYLASEQASSIHGAILPADGGRTAI